MKKYGKSKSDFKVLKSKPIFKGKLLSVSTKKIKLPNGHISNFEVIEHPGAALVVPFITKNKIALIKQLRPVINSYIYELPAGTLEKGETPLRCAKREIIEETGYSASKLTRLGVIFPVPGYSTEKITVYKAEGLKKHKTRKEIDEIIESCEVTKSQLKTLFRDGKIADAKTICALSYCGLL